MIIATAHFPGDFGRQTITDSFINVIMLLEHNTALQNFNSKIPHFPRCKVGRIKKPKPVGRKFI